MVSTTPPGFDSADPRETEPLLDRRVASLRGDHQRAVAKHYHHPQTEAADKITTTQKKYKFYDLKKY